ncbi:MAG: hypothetical protein GY871_04630 [Actinomycetales bacterium]|nr:hypothetical protein [Actinomycetales bacterium]
MSASNRKSVFVVTLAQGGGLEIFALDTEKMLQMNLDEEASWTDLLYGDNPLPRIAEPRDFRALHNMAQAKGWHIDAHEHEAGY